MCGPYGTTGIFYVSHHRLCPGDRSCATKSDANRRVFEPFRHEPHTTCARPWSCKTCFRTASCFGGGALYFRGVSCSFILSVIISSVVDIICFCLLAHYHGPVNCAAITDRSPRRKKINLIIMVELTFVNVNHPVQLRDPKHRRQIRSHISKCSMSRNAAPSTKRWENYD